MNRKWLLVAGAAIGALLAASELLRPGLDVLPADAVAGIDGDTISKADYLYFLDSMNKERRSPLDKVARERVLDRLIEEQLLIRRGVEMGLPWSESTVRKALVSTVIDTVIAEASTALPDDNELQEFYSQNLDYFRPAPRLRAQRMAFRGEDAAQRARSAEERLDKESWSSVAAALSDPVLPELPAALLPASKLRDYLGAELTAEALRLSPGQHSAAIAETGGYSIVGVQGVEAGQAPPLHEIREQVLQEYRRRAEEAALRDYLEQLRAEFSISVDEAFLRELDETGDVAR
jgi:parvulin-like peptidyl-prolyl isomerase